MKQAWFTLGLLAAMLVAGLTLHLGAPWSWLASADEPGWRDVWHWDVKWPRALSAVLLGSGIGAAGWICQRVAHNPLASPALLGIPAASTLAVMLLLWTAGDAVLPANAVQAAALVGGLAAAALLMITAELRFQWHGTQLLLVGVALGAVGTAATLAVALHAEPVVYQFAMSWLLGSLTTASWRDVGALHAPWAIAMVLCLLATPRLLVLGFDDAAAVSLGASPRTLRRLGFCLAAGLTALTSSAGGAYAFLGFAAPHLVRRLGGSRADRPLTAALGGAAMLSLADGLVHRCSPGVELPAGVAVAGLCVPWLLVELAVGRLSHHT